MPYNRRKDEQFWRWMFSEGPSQESKWKAFLIWLVERLIGIGMYALFLIDLKW